MQETVSITSNLANAVLNYLSTRPYNEVYILIQELMRQANDSKEASVEKAVDKGV